MTIPNAEDLKVTFSRGKVTFGLSTTTRDMTWVITSETSPEQVLDVLQDILSVVRPQSTVPAMDIQAEIARLGGVTPYNGEIEVPVSDGIAFQPPKHTRLGGTIDLGNEEPAAK